MGSLELWYPETSASPTANAAFFPYPLRQKGSRVFQASFKLTLWPRMTLKLGL